MSKILKSILVITLISMLIVFVNAATPKWYLKLRQIKLMETKQEQIEKLFNYPKVIDSYDGEIGRSIKYQLKEGELSVVYSLGKCVGNSNYVYNVEKNVITKLDFDLKKYVSFSKLNLDLRSFDRTEVSDLPGMFDYRNESLGEHYFASNSLKNGTKEIREIQFFPSESQEKLQCKNREL